jgi:ribonuclease HII
MDIIVGVDEVGRGAWAGPVSAGAVIIPENVAVANLRDSKALTPTQREKLSDLIYTECQCSVAHVDPATIDQMGIHNATLLAMRLAIEGLEVRPTHILVDGLHRIPEFEGHIRQTPVVKGDSIHECIMAASIIAKVGRDHLMLDFDSEFPEYDFGSHKGYGTKRHRDLLYAFGPCAIHRMTYKPVKKAALQHA